MLAALPCSPIELVRLNPYPRLDAPEMAVTLTDARGIIGHFKHCALATGELKNIANSVGIKWRTLKQDVPTRWGSTYTLCIALLHMKPALQVLLVVNL